jgi:hypothetical protein
MTKLVVFIAAFWVSVAYGQVSNPGGGSITGQFVGASSINMTFDVTSGANRRVVCFAANDGDIASISSYVIGTDSATVVNTISVSSGLHNIEMWSAALTVTGSQVITPTWTGLVDGVGGCLLFTGAGTLGTSQTTTDNVTGLSVSVPSGGMAMDVGSDVNGATGCAARTPQSAGQTKVTDTCRDQGAGGSLEAFTSTRSTTGAFTWDSDTGAFTPQIAVPINQAAAATVARRRILNQ